MSYLKLSYSHSAELKIIGSKKILSSIKSENNVRSGYSFGFNGQMKVNEMAGVGNHNTALFWEYDTRLGRRWDVDPMAHLREWISPYSALQNSPISRVDPSGDLDGIFDEQKDGSWKKREDVKNDGGERNHTFVYKNGDISYYNGETGKINTVNAGSSQRKIAEYKERQIKINKTIEKTGSVINDIGDGIALAGYAAAPFTEGASIIVATAGEIISLSGSALEHAAKVNREGLSEENLTDIVVDAVFILAPVPLEKTIKKTNLDASTKKILKAQVNKVNLGVEFGVKQNDKKNDEK